MAKPKVVNTAELASRLPVVGKGGLARGTAQPAGPALAPPSMAKAYPMASTAGVRVWRPNSAIAPMGKSYPVVGPGGHIAKTPSLAHGVPEPLTPRKTGGKPCCDDCGKAASLGKPQPCGRGGGPIRSSAPARVAKTLQVGPHRFDTRRAHPLPNGYRALPRMALESRPCCGAVSPYVFHGSPVSVATQDQLGLVSVSDNFDTPGMHVVLPDTCSGVLVSRHWALTVQHCFARPQFVPSASHRVRFLGEVQPIDRMIRLGRTAAMIHFPEPFSGSSASRTYAEVSPFSLDVLQRAAPEIPVRAYGIGFSTLAQASSELGTWRSDDFLLAGRQSDEAIAFHQSVVDAIAMHTPHAEPSDTGLIFSKATPEPQELGGDSGGPWFLTDYGSPAQTTNLLVGLTESTGGMPDGRWFASASELYPWRAWIRLIIAQTEPRDLVLDPDAYRVRPVGDGTHMLVLP